MRKEFICIECPKGCRLSVDIESDKVVNVTGNKCKKGKAYALCEVENPMRILTTSVLAKGLNLKMVPVKTSKPISKNLIPKALDEIKKIILKEPKNIGEVVVKDFLVTGADLITTRTVNIQGQ